MDKYQGASVTVHTSNQVNKHFFSGDYSQSYEDERLLILAVSSGVKGNLSFRSYRGAYFAVKAAKESMLEFASKVDEKALFGDQREQERMIRQLECSIIVRWRDYVNKDLENYPFRQEEIEEIKGAKYKVGNQKGTDPEYVYRANVMAAVMSKEYCLIVRNGNGECTIIEQNQKNWEPIPWNKKCRKDNSTNIYEGTAIQDFCHFCSKSAPVALFLVTDGMRYYFDSDRGYHEYLRQLFLKIKQSQDEIKKILSEELLELKQKNSDSEMCLAIGISADIFRTEIENKEKQERESGGTPGIEHPEYNEEEPTLEEAREGKEVTAPTKTKEISTVLQQKRFLQRPILTAIVILTVFIFIKSFKSDTEVIREEVSTEEVSAEQEPSLEAQTEEVTKTVEHKMETEVETAAEATEEQIVETDSEHVLTEEETESELPKDTTAAQTTKERTQESEKPHSTKAKQPTKAPPPPQTTVAPPPETPPMPPPSETVLETPAAVVPTIDEGQAELDEALQMWKVH